MTLRGPFQPKLFYYSVWEHHLEHLPKQGVQPALQHQLFFSCATSGLSGTDSCPAPHPPLELHFPAPPGLYHSCPQGYTSVTSCHMEILMGLGTGTCVLPLPSLASAGGTGGTCNSTSALHQGRGELPSRGLPMHSEEHKS